MPLAFGAMPVTATVVANMNMVAVGVGALVDMPSQQISTA